MSRNRINRFRADQKMVGQLVEVHFGHERDLPGAS